MLRRGVQQPLRALGSRLLSGSSASSAAAPAVAVAAKKGFLSQLLGGSSRVSVPMTEALPGVVEPTPVAFDKAPVTQTTTLPNGVRIVSENTPGATATLGMYVDSGSVYEDASTAGASHLLEYLAFKSTTSRSSLRVVREVEAMGANVLASAGREQLAYTIDAPVQSAAAALEVLADAVVNARFAPWEVEDARQRLARDASGLGANPQSLLLEGAHEAAYQGALGRPLLALQGCAAGAEAVASFARSSFAAPRLVLAAAGVEHGELVALAEPLLGALPAGERAPAPESVYVGGDWRRATADEGGLVHVLLGFEYAGGWRDVRGSVSMTVLQYLLGGGGSFSAGGPGKGMHSRLYTRVLNHHPWVHACAAASALYNATGLVGATASVEAARAEEGVAVLVREMQALVKPVPAEELARAKAATRSAVLMNLESRAVVAEDMGRQVLTYGERLPLAAFFRALDELTPEALAKDVAALLKRPPTLAAVGQVGGVPRYDVVARQFQ